MCSVDSEGFARRRPRARPEALARDPSPRAFRLAWSVFFARSNQRSQLDQVAIRYLLGIFRGAVRLANPLDVSAEFVAQRLH